jgi:hypothetical protein
MLLAVLGAAGAIAVAAADISRDPAGSCPDGLEWAVVSAVQDSAASADPLLVDYRERFDPILIGCLYVDDLTPADVPDPRS